MIEFKQKFIFKEMRWYCDITDYVDKLLKVESTDNESNYCYLEYEYSNYKHHKTNIFSIRYLDKTIGNIIVSDNGIIESISFYDDKINVEIIKEAFIGESIDLNEFNKIKFIRNNLGGDKQILWFIANFLYHSPIINDSAKSISCEFTCGYCYYFALILKDAFNRGEICYAHHLGHIVWLDNNDIAYDITGIHKDSSVKYYIPIKYMKEGINDFKRVPGIGFNASIEFVEKVVEDYERENEIIRSDE